MEQALTVEPGVDLCVERFGDVSAPTVLLIAGMTQSMDAWDVAFCERLAESGRDVIRYDHRDTGRATTSPVGRPSYNADDLATDPLRILDALGIDRAHLVGVSMGGGIAQELAALHPDRILTVTLIATTAAGERTSADELPSFSPVVADAFEHPPAEPSPGDRAAAIEYLVELERPYAGSAGFDEARTRQTATTVVDRSIDVRTAVANHALLDQGTARFRLDDIRVPTLVLHGDADPLFPLAHGEALAAEIPGATLLVLEGMGHEVPPPRLWDVVAPAIIRHTTG